MAHDVYRHTGMKTIAQVLLPNGTIAERQSASRTYTHAILVIDTPAAKAARVARAQAELARVQAKLAAIPTVGDEAAARAEAGAMKAKLDLGSGDAEWGSPDRKANWDAWCALNHRYHNLPVILRDSANWELGIASERLADAQRDEAPSINQWSMSGSNARKGASTLAKKPYMAGYDISVVPTTQATKAAKVATRGVR